MNIAPSDLNYLSNALHEVVCDQGVVDRIKASALGWHESPEGHFLPFTKEEKELLSDDVLNVAAGFGAMLGYTVLIDDKKWHAPSTEIFFGKGGCCTEEQATEFANRLVEALKPGIEAVGGHVVVEIGVLADRHVVTTLIPMSYALSRAKTAAEWSDILETELLNDGLSLEPGPIPGR